MIQLDEISPGKTKELDVVDITPAVRNSVKSSGIRNGIVNIFVPGSTGAITTVEYEPGLCQDLPSALERLFPRDIEYKHELTWHDGNGHSHVRAAILGPSFTAPIRNRSVQLGTWQQIVFVELDNKPRERKLLVQVVGE